MRAQLNSSVWTYTACVDDVVNMRVVFGELPRPTYSLCSCSELTNVVGGQQIGLANVHKSFDDA